MSGLPRPTFESNAETGAPDHEWAPPAAFSRKDPAPMAGVQMTTSTLGDDAHGPCSNDSSGLSAGRRQNRHGYCTTPAPRSRTSTLAAQAAASQAIQAAHSPSYVSPEV